MLWKKMTMMVPTCNLSHERLGNENQKLKVRLGYGGTTCLTKVGREKEFSRKQLLFVFSVKSSP